MAHARLRTVVYHLRAARGRHWKQVVIALAAAVALAAGIVTFGLPPGAKQQYSIHAEAAAKQSHEVNSGDDLLPGRVLAGPGDIRPRQSGTITYLAFTPDGTLLVSCSAPGKIAVWDVTGGGELHRLGDDRTEMTCAALAANGTIVGGGDSEGFIHVWDPANGQKLRAWNAPPVHPLPGPPSNTPRDVRALAVSSDGNAILSLDWMGTPRAWDPRTGRQLPSRPFLDEPFVQGTAYSPDGSRLAISYLRSSGGSGAAIWSPKQQDHTPPAGAPVLPGTPAIARSTDTPSFAAPAALPELPGSPIEGSPRIPPPPPSAPPPGQTAASEPRRCEYRIDLHDSKTGLLERSIIVSKGSAAFLTFSPDGKTLAACRRSPSLLGGGPPDEAAIFLWDVTTGKERRGLAGHSQPAESCAFSPDGRHLASASTDGSVRLWDVESGKQVRQFGSDAGGMFAVAFSPDGQTLAAGGETGAIRLWNVQAGEELLTKSGHH